MNWNRIEGRWNELAGQVKSEWAKLTDDDLKNVAGKRDQLVGKLQQHYGIESAVLLLLLSCAPGCGESGSGATNVQSDGAAASGTGGSGAGGVIGGGGRATGGVPAQDGGRGNGGASGAPPTSSGGAAAAALPVELGASENYVVLAKTGISTVPTSAVTGNIGVSPAAATYITGFSLTADATKAFATSTQVTGKVYAANYASPTPSNMTTAVGDMERAFTDAAGRAPDVTELGAGNIGGMTLDPGVYKWATGLMIPTDVTLRGDATAVWVFQIAQSLTMSSAASVMLTGGALPRNVFWQVTGKVELGTTTHFEGVVLTKTSVTLRTGASINGRLLAQTAVSIDGSTLVEPTQ